MIAGQTTGRNDAPRVRPLGTNSPNNVQVVPTKKGTVPIFIPGHRPNDPRQVPMRERVANRQPSKLEKFELPIGEGDDGVHEPEPRPDFKSQRIGDTKRYVYSKISDATSEGKDSKSEPGSEPGSEPEFEFEREKHI